MKSVFFVVRSSKNYLFGQDEINFLKNANAVDPTAESGSKLKKTFLPFKFVLKPEIPIKDEKKDEIMYRLPPNFTNELVQLIMITAHPHCSSNMLRVNKCARPFKNLAHKKTKIRI